jgi:hypothetical protein
MMHKGASLALAAVLAATLCLGMVILLTTENSSDFATSLMSAKEAKQEAVRDAELSKESATSAGQEASRARRDLSLAQKDLRIRQALLRAAAQQRRNGGLEAQRINQQTDQAMSMREHMEQLAEELTGVRQDMARTAMVMHKSVTNTDHILGGVKELEADAKRVAADGNQLRVEVPKIAMELKQQLQNVHRADIILAKGAAMENSVEEKAKYAAGKAKLAVDEDNYLEAKARVLRKSALILAEEAAQKGEASAQKEADSFAVKQGQMQAAAQNAAKKANLLAAKAKEAQSYVDLLRADMAAAEQKAQSERQKLVTLHKQFVVGKELEMQGLRKEQVCWGYIQVCVLSAWAYTCIRMFVQGAVDAGMAQTEDLPGYLE